MSCADVRRLLERHGVLLLQDKKLPSVAGTIAGQTLSVSWWSHPRAQEIFQCLGQLEDEAVATRLIGRKVTWVHKRLWPELIAVGESNAPWQTDRLSAPARRLLRSLKFTPNRAVTSCSSRPGRTGLDGSEYAHTLRPRRRYPHRRNAPPRKSCNSACSLLPTRH